MSDGVRSKHTLDKDLARLSEIEEATGFVARGLIAPGLGLLFLMLAASAASIYVFGEPRAVIVIVAAAIAAYLAMNIGANDVTNNVGPAVGAGAMTMVGALGIAAVFEIAGALIAGDAVVAGHLVQLGEKLLPARMRTAIGLFLRRTEARLLDPHARPCRNRYGPAAATASSIVFRMVFAACSGVALPVATDVAAAKKASVWS